MVRIKAKLKRRPRSSSGSSGWQAICALFIIGVALFTAVVRPAVADPLAIKVGVIHETHSRETISILDIPPADDFVAGARMAMDDNNTTGRFLDQSFSVVDAKLNAGEDPIAALKGMLDDGVRFFIVDLPPAEVLAVADAARAPGALVFNAGARDDRLREEDCRANVIHTAPTRSMLTDGLAQYLIWKQWRRWFLVVGSHPEDKLLGEAYRRSAKKFGAKIVEERVYEDTGGGRRSDSGSVQVQRQMPVFTQNAPDYDVLVAADENEVFAGFLPYRTWDARLVVGSAGLRPVSWDPSHEFWGAVQLQNRFQRAFKRGMTQRDNQAWEAMRLIGDAVAHTKSADPKTIHDELLSPSFTLGAFKGQGTDLAPVEPAAASADPAHRRAGHGFGFAAGRLPASDIYTRHPRLRSAGDKMQTSMKRMACCVAAMALLATPGAVFGKAMAATAYITNEKGNSISVIDLDKLEVTRTVKTGQRPRGIALSKDGAEMFVCLGDDDRIAVIDTKTLKEVGELPSGPDPEQLRVSPDGKLVFVANENDALLTAIDVATRKVVSEFPVGVEPEGVAVSPDGSIVVNTSETTSMAHLIDWRNKKIVANILVPPRPRYAEYNKDGSELWVSSEVGGTVSVIDPVKHVVTHTISFEVPGLAERADPASRHSFQRGRQAGVRRDGAGQSRRGDRRGDQKGAQIFAGRPACLAIGADARWQVSVVDQWRFE